jgi:hypothetical protein
LLSPLGHAEYRKWDDHEEAIIHGIESQIVSVSTVTQSKQMNMLANMLATQREKMKDNIKPWMLAIYMKKMQQRQKEKLNCLTLLMCHGKISANICHPNSRQTGTVRVILIWGNLGCLH